MHGLAKGCYVSSVLGIVGPVKHLASSILGFTHRTSYGELGNGGNHGVYITEAKV